MTRTRAVGEVIYFTPEDMTILVVMANEEGVRYIDPNELEFEDNGSLKTLYAENAALDEWSVSVGPLSNMSAYLAAMQSKKKQTL